MRAAYQATPWGLVTFGVNLPTGNAQHDAEEAIVASRITSYNVCYTKLLRLGIAGTTVSVGIVIGPTLSYNFV